MKPPPHPVSDLEAVGPGGTDEGRGRRREAPEETTIPEPAGPIVERSSGADIVLPILRFEQVRPTIPSGGTILELCVPGAERGVMVPEPGNEPAGGHDEAIPGAHDRRSPPLHDGPNHLTSHHLGLIDRRHRLRMPVHQRFAPVERRRVDRRHVDHREVRVRLLCSSGVLDGDRTIRGSASIAHDHPPCRAGTRSVGFVAPMAGSVASMSHPFRPAEA